MEINVPLCRSSKLYPVVAFDERFGANGIVALCVGDIMLPLATATFGDVAGLIFVQTSKSFLLR